MKKFISGAVIGAVLTSSIALAINYTAEPASFKVMVNGKEFTSDPPALVVEGRTYLPLRAIGDALNVPVEWNAELNQAEVGLITKKVNEEYEGYLENPDVPNFGKILSIDPVEIKADNQSAIYKYDTSNISADSIKQALDSYVAAIKKNGYSFVGIGSNNGMNVYAYENSQKKALLLSYDQYSDIKPTVEIMFQR